MASEQLPVESDDKTVRSCDIEVKENGDADVEPSLKKVKTESPMKLEDETVRASNIEVEEDNHVDLEHPQIVDDSSSDDKYKKSIWGKLIFEDSRNQNSRFWSKQGQKEFKRRFGLRFDEYSETVRQALELLGNSDEACNSIGDIKVPLELKILCSLRLSKGSVDHDLVEEFSNISVEKILSFHNTFWKLFCEKHNKKWTKKEEEDDDF